MLAQPHWLLWPAPRLTPANFPAAAFQLPILHNCLCSGHCSDFRMYPDRVQVSCSYGASLSPLMIVDIYVAAALINKTYTAGYAPPPFVLADPNLVIPLTSQLTYSNNGTLDGVLTIPFVNNNTIQGDQTRPRDVHECMRCLLIVKTCHLCCSRSSTQSNLVSRRWLRPGVPSGLPV